MATISDNFNRSNESLDAGPWDEVVGNWEVNSNAARAATFTTDGFARHTSDLASSDQEAQVSWTPSSTSASRIGGVCCRANAANSNNYGFRIASSGAWNLHKRVSGTITNLATGSTTGGVPYTLKISASGTTIKAFIDGAEVASVTDSDIASGTRCGILYGSSTINAQTVDDFVASDLGGGGGGGFIDNTSPILRHIYGSAV